MHYYLPEEFYLCICTLPVIPGSEKEYNEGSHKKANSKGMIQNRKHFGKASDNGRQYTGNEESKAKVSNIIKHLRVPLLSVAKLIK